jgi:hypothetical protein
LLGIQNGQARLFLGDFDTADNTSGVLNFTFILCVVDLEILNFLRHCVDFLPVITLQLLFELLDPAGGNLGLEQ